MTALPVARLQWREGKKDDPRPGEFVFIDRGDDWYEERVVSVSKAECKTDRGTRIRLQNGSVVGEYDGSYSSSWNRKAYRDCPEVKIRIEEDREAWELSKLRRKVAHRLEELGRAVRRLDDAQTRVLRASPSVDQLIGALEAIAGVES